MLVVLHWKKTCLSLPFSFSEWSISRLQWNGKGAATADGWRRGQPAVHHHHPQRSSCQGWLPEHSSNGIRVWSWFPSCFGIYLNWHLKPLTPPACSDFSLPSSAAMKKPIRAGKVRGEREEVGPGIPVVFQCLWITEQRSDIPDAAVLPSRPALQYLPTLLVQSVCLCMLVQGWQKSFVLDRGFPAQRVSPPLAHLLLRGTCAERAGHGALPPRPCHIRDKPLSSLSLALIAFIMDTWLACFCWIK